MFKRIFSTRMIGSLVLSCFIFYVPMTPLRAECPQKCAPATEEDIHRNRVATVVAGTTLIALVGGVAALAFGGHHCHHSSNSSSGSDATYSYTEDPYSEDYSEYDDYDYDHPSRLYEDEIDDEDILDDGLVHDEFADGGQKQLYSIRCKKHCRSLKTDHQLTITFTSLSTTHAKGNCTPFVQLPDGSTHMLGTLSLSGKNQTITCGPYHAAGTYHFGMMTDGCGSSIQNIPLVGVCVTLDGETVQNETLSSHAKPHLSFTLEK